ncbi:MAG: hypothetical protein ACXADH_01285 [Candidatus Kariarchaeaceae archaeon]|jgi:hypothetical protein
MSDKRVFKANVLVGETKDGLPKFEEKEFAVVKPSVQQLKEANKIRSQVWNKAFEEGNLLRRQLDDELKNRNLWNNKLQAEYDTLQHEVLQNTLTLEKGGIKLSEARAIAIETSKKRQEMVEMLVARSELDNHTCEGQADNERFNFLFANCLVYNDTGEKVYPNGLDDYLKDADNEYAVKGATEFYYLMSNTESLDDKLPENQFLKKYKFIDEDQNFTDRATGRLVDADGRYIDENGFFVEYDEDGNSYQVTVDGERVSDLIDNEEGDDGPLPFLEDDGSPVDEVETSKPKPKKTTRKRRTTKKVETADADA